MNAERRAAATTRPTLDLKTFTLYRCTTPGCGNSSVWTGALTARRRPSDGYCFSCGQPMTEKVKDGRRWRVSFEMSGPYDADGWRTVTRETDSERDARDQVKGLHNLIAQGEPLRNVQLAVTTITWVEP